MKAHFFRTLIFSVLLTLSADAFCCTSVIISGKARQDGRPVMMKHRDSGELNSRMQRFDGPEYSFIGLVNSSSKGGEVWSGTNSGGFCIMNTATYDLKDDDVPAEQMDREGVLMYIALGKCLTVNDFQNLLDTLPRPMGVEANFGVIDAFGGAAYFEVNNHSWTRFDVGDEPGGYMVVTNFTRTGRVADRKGVDRFEKACGIMSSIDVATAGHSVLFNSISRSGEPIMRNITSSSIVFEGVKEGEDPLETVMWTILGCPTDCIYLPLMVSTKDIIPSFMKDVPGKETSQICDNALIIKGIYGFKHGCEDECVEIEKSIDAGFSSDMSPFRYTRFVKKAYRKYSLMCRRKLPKVSL